MLLYSTRSSSSDSGPPLTWKITKPPYDNKIGSTRQNPNLSCGYWICSWDKQRKNLFELINCVMSKILTMLTINYPYPSACYFIDIRRSLLNTVKKEKKQNIKFFMQRNLAWETSLTWSSFSISVNLTSITNISNTQS